MVTQQLLDYIKQQMQTGKSREQITHGLLASGWQADDVEQGFVSLNSGMPAPMNTELPKAREIFNEAWAIYKNRFKTLIAINLIPVLGFILLGFIVAILVISAKVSQTNWQGPEFLVIICLGFIALLALIYIGLWATVALLFAIKDQAEGIGWKEAFKRSRNKIWIFFGTSLLTGLAVFGGFILLIIPGVIFAFWFSQSPYIVVEENLGNTSALKRSKYYIKGRIGQFFGKSFHIGIITFGLYIGLAIIVGIFSSISHLNKEQALVARNIVNYIFNLFWAPVVTVYAYQLYKHLKATRP